MGSNLWIPLGVDSGYQDIAKSGSELGCMVLIPKEIIAKTDNQSEVPLSNLWSISLSNVKSMALVADNVTSDALTVEVNALTNH